jgi:hypothetical protein
LPSPSSNYELAARETENGTGIQKIQGSIIHASNISRADMRSIKNDSKARETT